MHCVWYHIAMVLVIKGGMLAIVGGPEAVGAEFPWIPDDDDEEKSDFYKNQFEDAPPVINALLEDSDGNQHLASDPPYDEKITDADGSMDVKGAVNAILSGRSINNIKLDIPEVDYGKYVATTDFVSPVSEDIKRIAKDIKNKKFEFSSSSNKHNSGDYSKDTPLVNINALPEDQAGHQHLAWNHPFNDESNNADDPMDVKGAVNALLAGRDINNYGFSRRDVPEVDFDKTQYVATAGFVSSDLEGISSVATDKTKKNHELTISKGEDNDDRYFKAAVTFLKNIQNNLDRKHIPRFEDEKNETDLIRIKKEHYFEMDLTRTREPDGAKDAVKSTLSPESDSSELNVSKAFNVKDDITTITTDDDDDSSQSETKDKQIQDATTHSPEFDTMELNVEDMRRVTSVDDITTTVTTDDDDNSNQPETKDKQIHGALHVSGRETKGTTPIDQREEDAITATRTNAVEFIKNILKQGVDKLTSENTPTRSALRQGVEEQLSSKISELQEALTQLSSVEFALEQAKSIASELSDVLARTSTTPPKLDIPALLFIISNLTADYETNLTSWVNETLHKWSIPTCPTPTTSVTTFTTDSNMLNRLDYESNGTGYLVGKCYVCGLEEEGIPRRALCADAFAGDFMPLMPVDPKARGQISLFRKYCRYMDIPHYHINSSDPRSMWGRWTGGCSVRWTDIASVFTQRSCRNRLHAVIGKHFASKRMAKLEMALQNIDDGCIGSPAASLLVLSRGISVYAKFHACVCQGSWCNCGVFGPQWTWYLAIMPLFAILVCW